MSIGASGLKNVDPSVVRAIRSASQDSNVDFGLMMAEAAQESGFRPDVRAATSSATGLYQFTDATWLAMVRKHGAEVGRPDLAAEIEDGPGGRPFVADPGVRKMILDLRTDPQLAAKVAAAFTRDNKADIEKAIGRHATSTDLYLAHFLGSGGAKTLLAADPQSSAAELFPGAAAANCRIFYEGGRSRSVAELYAKLQQKIEPAAASFADAGGVSRKSPPPAPVVDPSQKPVDILEQIRALKAMAASIMMADANKEQFGGDDDWEG